MRWLCAILVLSAAPAFAQGGAELTPPPEVTPAPEAVPQAFDPERPPRYDASPSPAPRYHPSAPTAPQDRYVRVLPSPEVGYRAERHARVLERRAHRLALRTTERPWRVRVGFFATASPRSMNGFGPYDDDQRWVYPGVGISGTVSRWLGTRLRVDVSAALAKVFGDYYSSGDHGVEGTLGLALTAHSRSRFRIGGGIGAALVMARELDEAAGGHFGWTGFRFGPVAELGWFNANERGVSIHLSPTFTWAPYATGLAPGVIFGVGVEI